MEHIETNITIICTVTVPEILEEMWVALDYCELCNTECAAGCGMCMIGDGECQDACFVFDCDYDQPDCDLCNDDCFPHEAVDDFCNEECNVENCNWDDKKCEEPDPCQDWEVTAIIDFTDDCQDS